MDIQAIQEYLREHNLDGWLLYDFQGMNPIACSMANIQGMTTRRWFCFIPAKGELQWIIPAIEQHVFDGKPGQFHVYPTWKVLWEKLTEILKTRFKIAMEYSPNCAIPYVSRVDAGTLELVRQMEVEIVSSGDLVQYFQARLTEKQYESHLKAVDAIYKIKDQTIQFVREERDQSLEVTEWMVQQFIADKFREMGIVTNNLPIIATNQHASNPHYEPREENRTPIVNGDLLLMDIWGKLDQDYAIYADITWMAFIGPEIPDEIQNVWDIVRNARDNATQFVKSAMVTNKVIHGYEVDEMARNVIKDAGYGEFFFHRTGHNIHEQDHGNGAHMDNFETYDERRILPRTLFSIEPGIYLPNFGIRSEINVYIHPEKGPQVTTLPQTGITTI